MPEFRARGAQPAGAIARSAYPPHFGYRGRTDLGTKKGCLRHGQNITRIFLRLRKQPETSIGLFAVLPLLSFSPMRFGATAAVLRTS